MYISSVLTAAVLLEVLNFLEVQCLNQRIQLIDSLLQIIINESISEQHWVICQFNLLQSILDTGLELILGLFTGTETAAELLEAGWVDEKEVAFNSLLIDLYGALHINLNQGNLALGLDALQLSICGTVEVSVDLAVLNEFTLFNALKI